MTSAAGNASRVVSTSSIGCRERGGTDRSVPEGKYSSGNGQHTLVALQCDHRNNQGKRASDKSTLARTQQVQVPRCEGALHGQELRVSVENGLDGHQRAKHVKAFLEPSHLRRDASTAQRVRSQGTTLSVRLSGGSTCVMMSASAATVHMNPPVSSHSVRSPEGGSVLLATASPAPTRGSRNTTLNRR